MKYLFHVCALLVGALLFTGGLWAQIDNNKDLMVIAPDSIDDLRIVLQGPEKITNHYDGFPQTWHFLNFSISQDMLGNTVLHWANPQFDQMPPGQPMPPGAWIHVGFSVADTSYMMMSWCFTWHDIPVWPVIQVWAYTPLDPPEQMGDIILNHSLDESCGPQPDPLFIGNVIVEFFADRQPLETLNDSSVRPYLRRDTIFLMPPMPLPRFASQQLPLPDPPGGTRYVVWIFDVFDPLQRWSRDFKQFPIAMGSIEGYKFRDRDGDGIRDAGEPGLEGWYISLNGPVNAVTQTDTSGYYAFTDLPPGGYLITEDNQVGWIQTLPSDPGSYTVVLGRGEGVKGRDFGNGIESIIMGRKYNDMDGDGELDPTDPPLGGWVIQLYDSLRRVTYVDTSSDSGTFSFGNLRPGIYIKKEILVPGWIATAPPGITEGDTIIVETDSTIVEEVILNFKTFCLSGVKFWDRDGDGDHDPGEEGLRGWNITLYAHGTVVTDTAGYYEFCDLGPGMYSVCEELKAKWIPTCDTCRIFGGVSGYDVVYDFCNFREEDTVLYRTFTCAQLETVACANTKPVKDPKAGKPPTVPNLVNVLSEINQLGGIVQVGISGWVGYNFEHAYLLPPKYKDIMKTLCSKSLTHTRRPCVDIIGGFDFDLKGKIMKKRWKSMQPHKVNNHVMQELLTLQINLVASDLGITTPGLRTLSYYDPGHPLDGWTLDSIALTADTMMTKWHYYLCATYDMFDTVVARINDAFDGPFDYGTAKWIGPPAGTLEIPGVLPVSAVSYLRAAPGIVPWTRLRENTVESTPDVFDLEQNYPNPFNPVTTIRFNLPEDGIVTLRVYNALGQEVAVLLDREALLEGTEEVDFDASALPSGVYFYRMSAQLFSDDGNEVVVYDVRKMVLMK
ncbi:MAG TPA: SdrD B-like domain-containing protein [Bacteroidota bacterium]|nr:SdrD B-like domain-containing protein [Bacteroidota bacterium]